MNGAWFCALGEALNPGEEETLRRYLTGLGVAEDVGLRSVGSWGEARDIVADPDWDQRLWRAEQSERTRLLSNSSGAQQAVAVAAFEAISDKLHGCAAVAAARMGCGDAGLIRAAAGAATEAAYLAELRRVAGAAESHPFACKLMLFESGHWPLALVQKNYYIF